MAISDTHSEGVLYDAIDPLRPSLNKLQMISALVDPDERDAYYFNIIKYHSRWKDMSASAVQNPLSEPSDIYKGFIPFDIKYSGANRIPDYDSITAVPLAEENLDALNDILSFVSENDATLILMIAPYYVEGHGRYLKSVRSWAEQNGVEIIDYSLLLEEIHIDPETDYVDTEHLSVRGASKLSLHLSNVLKEKGLSPEFDDPAWEADLKYYTDKFGRTK